MAQQFQPDVYTIIRRKEVEAATGYSRSTIYWRIEQGLLPKPIRLGARAVGWVASEISAVNAARIQGRSDDEIRVLVVQLHEERNTVSADHLRGEREHQRPRVGSGGTVLGPSRGYAKC